MRDFPLLVTGATGFLGTHIVKHFLKLGAKITAISLAEPNSDFPEHQNLSLELRDIRDISTSELERFKGIIHLAALSLPRQSISNPYSTFEINTLLTVHLLEKIRKIETKPHFIFPSSALVYGETKNNPINEEHPLNPVTPYAASKVAAEIAITSYNRNYDIPCTILRLFNTYGPGQPNDNVIPTIIKQSFEKSEITLFNSSSARDFIYVDDTVSVIEKILNSPVENSGEIYNLGTGKSTKIKDLVHEISDIMGKELTIQEMNPENGTGKNFSELKADINKIKNGFDWEPKYNIQQGLRRTLEIEKTSRN